MQRLIFVMILFAATLNVSAQQEESDPSKPLQAVLSASKGLKTFSKAIEIHELNFAFLKFGDVPFTIFVPSDSVLAKLDKAAKTDKEKIKNTLLNPNAAHHAQTLCFLGKKITSKQLMAMAKNKTKLKNPLTELEYPLTIKGDSIFIDGLKVTQPDIQCKGGVIHVIDGILRPRS